MHKQLLLIAGLLFAAWQQSMAATGDTTIIVAHALTNLNSPPSNDDIWASFPNNGTTYQKIIMKFTLGCGTPNCSGWDYTVNTSLGKKNGMLDSTIVSVDTIAHDTTWSYSDHINFMEVGRLITPYGTYMANNSNGYNKNWTHPYYYDVTDYAPILKDSVNVRVHYDGWSDAFSAKIEFICIEGPLTRTVEDVREIYNTYIGYPDHAGFESVATAKTFSLSPSVTSAKVVVTMTGHGNQGEFDPRYFHLLVNGNEVYSHILWKDNCDINAIAPQGGTWVFARANWCPGEKVPVYEVDITPYITPGQNVTVDLDMDDFALQSGASAGYGTSAYLITYSSQKDNDVMLAEIIAPNSDKPYLHWNPISTNPKVLIKNTGKKTLTYAEISYWVKGGPKWYYEWRGNLPAFESEQITLPAFDWNGLDTTDRVFYAQATWPNNVVDQYPLNDLAQSSFNMTSQREAEFILSFKTNNHPEENWYSIVSEDGDTLYSKSSFAPNTTVNDTFSFLPGSYILDFNDYDGANWGCGDGLRFFVNQPPNATTADAWYETSGSLALKRLDNTVIKNFNADFGGNIHYEFTVDYPLGYNTPKNAPTAPDHTTAIKDVSTDVYGMNIYPNPAITNATVVIAANINVKGMLTVTDITGHVVQDINVEPAFRNSVVLPLSGYAKGIYFVSFTSGSSRTATKLVVQ